MNATCERTATKRPMVATRGLTKEIEAKIIAWIDKNLRTYGAMEQYAGVKDRTTFWVAITDAVRLRDPKATDERIEVEACLELQRMIIARWKTGRIEIPFETTKGMCHGRD
jgi:hypothetical protein